MELNLHPIATKCFVSGRDFQENDRVVSYLVREAPAPGAPTGEVARRDLLEGEDGRFMPPAFVYCRWVVAFKQRKADENPALTLKLTAENLFLTLAAPDAERSAINTPLLQFLALMLERKKLIKLRGRTEDGQRHLYEHMATHQSYEVPVGDLNVEFFQKIQEHLGVLVGAPKPKPQAPVAPAPVG
jgi:hypothetical protein